MNTTDGNGRICPFCGGSGTAFRRGLEEIENEAVSDGLVKRLENEARKHSRESELYTDLVEAARFIAAHLDALDEKKKEGHGNEPHA